MPANGTSVPHVSVAEFLAYPQYLDLGDLVVGGSDEAQNNELTNILLRASQLADAWCRQPLAHHLVTRTKIAPVLSDGCILIVATDRPFIAWQQITVAKSALDTPYVIPAANLDAAWPDQTGVLWRVPLQNTAYAWPGYKLYVSATYLAGYPSTFLSAPANEGDTLVIAADQLAINTGQELRLWSPLAESDTTGGEESIIVDPSYVNGSTTVPITYPLLNNHAIGDALSGMPADIHEAVILWAIALLLRPSAGGSDDPFSDAAEAPTTTDKSTRRTGRGFISQAQQILEDGGYRRVPLSLYLVRDAIATSGGAPVAGNPNAHRGAGVIGLGTVFTRKPKRYVASDHFAGQPTSAGRTRSGAIAVVGVDALESRRLTPPIGTGQLRRTYEGVLRCFHLSYSTGSEAAEADFEQFMESVEQHLRNDPTLGRQVFTAGEGAGTDGPLGGGRIAWRLHKVESVAERTEVTADMAFTVIEIVTG